MSVECSCGEEFCLCCGAKPHEPAPCAAVGIATLPSILAICLTQSLVSIRE